MKRVLSIGVSLLTSSAVVVLLVASPAVAMKPQTFSFNFDDQFIDTESCDFDVHVRFVGSLSVTEFFDQDGNLVRAQAKGQDVGTATNPLNGKTATGVDNWLEVFDVGSEEFSIRGLVFHLNFPGAGVVLIDAGILTFDADDNVILVGGPHQVFEGDFEALCAALGNDS